jgi:hypothetical protein
VRREDVQAFLRRPWGEIRRAKEDFWVAELARMSLAEAFALADSLRQSALLLAGDDFLALRSQDLQDLVEFKRTLERAGHAAGRA